MAADRQACSLKCQQFLIMICCDTFEGRQKMFNIRLDGGRIQVRQQTNKLVFRVSSEEFAKHVVGVRRSCSLI